MEPDPLQLLPVEIWELVLSCLRDTDVARFGRCSWMSRSLVQRRLLRIYEKCWRDRVQRIASVREHIRGTLQRWRLPRSSPSIGVLMNNLAVHPRGPSAYRVLTAVILGDASAFRGFWHWVWDTRLDAQEEVVIPCETAILTEVHLDFFHIREEIEVEITEKCYPRRLFIHRRFLRIRPMRVGIPLLLITRGGLETLPRLYVSHSCRVRLYFASLTGEVRDALQRTRAFQDWGRSGRGIRDGRVTSRV